jgi:hypothetical protein
MPVLKTALDKYGRLRSIATFNCNDCNDETSVRLDEFKRRGALCKKCKIVQNSKIGFDNKNFELVCANIFKSRLNKRYIKRGLICSLNNIEILELVKSNCHYCGDKPKDIFKYIQKHFEYNFLHNGIDRIDSSLGYIQGNVVACCKECNISKMDTDYQQYLNRIEKIYLNRILCQ